MTQAGLIRWFLHPGPRLSQRVLHAGLWAFSLRIFLRLFSTIRIIILARLLAPADFGLMGIALMMMSLLETFTAIGFSAALVQRKGDIRPYLDTAWTVGLLRYLVVAGALVLAAPFVASFFHTPAATLVVRVMAIAILMNGFTNIGIVYFQKELEFQKRFIYEVAPAVAEVGVGIGLALALQNVWALVYGALAGSVVQAVVSYLLHPYRPRLRLERAKARDLSRFGRWVLGLRVLSYLMNHLSDLFVGKILDVMALGLYRMASTLSQLVNTEITNVANQVAFPAYSKLQERLDKLRSVYLQTLQLMSFLTIPLAAGIIVLAPDLVYVILGSRWLPMVPVVQVLTIWSLIRSLSAARGALWPAIGRPELPTKLLLVNGLLLAALLYPLTLLWGMLGAALAVVLSGAAVYPVGVWLATKAIQCPVTWYLKELVAPGICSLLMVGVLFLVKMLALSQPSIGSVVGLVVLGLLSYLGFALLFVRFFNYSIGANLRQVLLAR